MKIGPNRKSRVRMARVLRTGLYVAYALPRLQGLYDAVNIKLDKCGGFTEALALANEARRLRFEIMVGATCAARRSPWLRPFSSRRALDGRTSTGRSCNRAIANTQ